MKTSHLYRLHDVTCAKGLTCPNDKIWFSKNGFCGITIVYCYTMAIHSFSSLHKNKKISRRQNQIRSICSCNRHATPAVELNLIKFMITYSVCRPFGNPIVSLQPMLFAVLGTSKTSLTVVMKCPRSSASQVQLIPGTTILRTVKGDECTSENEKPIWNYLQKKYTRNLIRNSIQFLCFFFLFHDLSCQPFSETLVLVGHSSYLSRLKSV